MKQTFTIIFFFISLSTSAQNVLFSAQNGASLSIAENASVNFNGMKLSPSSELQFSDNQISFNTTPLSDPFTSTSRVYSLSNGFLFSGELKIYYDDSIEELNGIDEVSLGIAILDSNSNWVEVQSSVDSDLNSIYASIENQAFSSIALLESGSILSVITNNNNNIRVYPNPVSSILHINSKELHKISIYDLNGKLLLQKEVNSSLNLSDLPKATYLMSLSNLEGIVLENFTIIKN